MKNLILSVCSIQELTLFNSGIEIMMVCRGWFCEIVLPRIQKDLLAVNPT